MVQTPAPVRVAGVSPACGGKSKDYTLAGQKKRAAGRSF
ncbi:hypothetical protein GEOBRER4_n3986 [Citrifermentans bremense]|uniref:Uncharacterized protein n=2 Tax=Geobacteraceae TaxID=213422 RepID=A0ABQ0MMX2_9BACT|nr:hypothetical protein GEOBRER4_n3986 [Citrifermentans bremense]GAW68432.1 hypothetical protein GPEL0_01r4781 [Geoanaerobacter pelophilus]